MKPTLTLTSHLYSSQPVNPEYVMYLTIFTSAIKDTGAKIT